jgi:gamma-glutamylputrescine oxidase
LKEFGEEAIGYENCGSREVFTVDNAELGKEVLEFLPQLNETLVDVFGGMAFEVVAGGDGVDGCGLCISSPFEGLLDTAALYREFLSKNINSGVDVLNGVRVEEIVKSENGWELRIDGGVVQARQVLVANNSMAAELLPDLDVRPEVNRVLVTEVMPGLAFYGTCHHDRGYVYLRRIDTPEGPRMLIGGGRQWGDGDSDEVREKLITFLRTHIVGAEKAEVEYEWKGYLGIGEVRNPICKTLKPGLHVGVRLGGMGVALGGELGVELARLAQ